MLDALPEDVLVHVCLFLDQPSVERVCSTCRALRQGDGFYGCLGTLQWGTAFWKEALTRPTMRHVYRGMRHELRCMHRHACELRRLHLAEWTQAEYRMWWACEARFIGRTSAAATAPVPWG
tara:strand:- start:1268 stop:1630 length:363 start_codon:yes stop_codon:yes gene_type:complete